VNLGIGAKPELNVVYNCSAWEANKPLPTQCRPDLAYRGLFGTVAGKDAKQQAQGEANVLEFMAADLKRLEGRLAGPEREKLEAYKQTFEAMRERQSRLNELEATLRAKGPVVSDKYASDVETDRLDAHFDLAAAALVCGLTNVVTIASGVGSICGYFDITFGGLGLRVDKHGIGHGSGQDGKSAVPLMHLIRKFHFELIARLVKKLESVKEGDGTMLDNTVIVYTSDNTEQHHSLCKEWPFVLIGTAGGALKGGQYVEYPGYGQKGHRVYNSLYATLLNAAGDASEFFGVADPQLRDLDLRGRLGELWA
jgi:hypothetical protein